MRIDSQKAINIHQAAIRDFDRVQTASRDEREQALQDRRFYSISGAQWEGDIGDQFENKPKFEVNKVHLSLIKIFNEYRNNRISVDFVSKDGTPDEGLADTCDGLFRADEQDSCAEEAYDNAFEESVGGGIGAWRLTTEYEDEDDDENEKQRIRIEPIYDADSSVFFDLDAKRQDKSDAKKCWVIHSMSHDEYREEFGREPSPINKLVSEVEYDWYTPDLVYFAEYYRLEKEQETVHYYKSLTGEEETYTDQDFEDDEELEARLRAMGMLKVREKRTKRRRVHKYLIDGSGMLEDCGVIAGKHIPIVPTYGKRWMVESVERFMGHVRLVKDSQRLKNMLTSQLAEISSLSTVEKPIFTPEQVAGHEWMWADDNIRNFPYQLVNPIEDSAGNIAPSGPIGYTKPPQVPPALAALMQLADIDMKELLGGSAETDKMLSHVSGKAHEMIQKRIDGQAFIYLSNFSKAVKRSGEIWLSMAKDVYVEKGRKMKTVDSLGEVDSVTLSEPAVGGDRNNITEATFDVRVDVGPSSASQREATVQTILGMMQVAQDPQTQQVLQNLALFNMEGDGIGQARGYFRKQLVQAGVIPPTEEEAAAMAEAAKEPSPQEQALLGMAAESNAKAQKIQAEVMKVLSDIELNAAKTAETYSEVDMANLNRVKAQIEAEQQQLQNEQVQIQNAMLAQQAMTGGGMPPQNPGVR